MPVTYDQDPEHVFMPGEEVVWIDAIRRLAPRILSGDVLDIGCGTGLLTMLLARHGASVIGLDRSSDHLRIARRKRAVAPDLQARMRFAQAPAFSTGS